MFCVKRASVAAATKRQQTLGCKVNYIRSVSEGDLFCHAWLLHSGRRTQVIEAEVHQGDKLVAKAQATFARV